MDISVFDSFPQITEKSVPDQIVDSFRRALIEKQLSPGDRIPSEMELCEKLNVSRGAIREAMKILQSYGIVDIRRGDGTYISTNADHVSMDSAMFGYLLLQPTRKEQIEFRWYMEKLVLELAIINASKEDIDNLENNYNEMLSILSDPSGMAKKDMEFHALLGKASGNRLLAKTYDLAMIYCREALESSHVRNKGCAAIKVHRMTINAIKEKDFIAVESIVNESIRSWSTDADGLYFGTQQ